MKFRDAILPLVVAAGALTASAVMSPADQQRYEQLQAKPITLYPEIVPAQSDLPRYFSARARADDAIVISHGDALKVSARIAQLGVEHGEVWVHVPRDLDLTQNGRKNLEGAKGIVYVPAGRLSARRLSTEARQLAEKAGLLGCRLIVGLEPEQARTLNHIAEIAPHASILTIYDNQRMRRGAAEYRAHVERLVHEARAVNAGIQVEICISTGADAAATKALAGVLWTCADLADRIGIYCDDTPASRASLDLLYQVLRGPPSA